jgi:NADPH-dependent 2,4-dienoyl-CoA reductase/sulfur reductase-like enzyme/Fe-S-cluster-containing hydrogenase component 2/bacterioferritin-associated ferredoxin
MTDYRIKKHPILSVKSSKNITFHWQGQPLIAKEGEMISSALFANGVETFGHHSKDGAPQGIFCANGQCSQCLVIADGVPVKACMTRVEAGMRVEPSTGLPDLPKVGQVPSMSRTESIAVPVLIIGGGPSGMSAAAELGRHGIRALLVDDRHRLGGKLVLQTHRFFGSTNAVHAGTRGIDIATQLESKTRDHDTTDVWLNSVAVAVFSDHKVGILRNNKTYVLVRPQVLLVATGARERSLVFKGNTLPGVYGAGAFQTLVNRDLVKPSKRLFIVGGGNVGLIAGYHALQAGIQVVGLVEALPECGGYKVHRDKLVRLGVPIYTSHTVLSANGETQVKSVTIAQVDEHFQPIRGTEKSFACDTVLIAVGLNPVNEFYEKAQEYKMQVFAAGDAQEIAEASAAMFTGKIAGRKVARALGVDVGEIPAEWVRMAEILKSSPGRVDSDEIPAQKEGVFPVLHCRQEIPCDPCAYACPLGLIDIDETDIRRRPKFVGPEIGKKCIGCENCITACPGLAITLVDYRQDKQMPTVALAYEFLQESIKQGQTVTAVDTEGEVLGEVEVKSVQLAVKRDHTAVVKVEAPKAYAKRIAGIRVQQPWVSAPLSDVLENRKDEMIACRCERVAASEIRQLIREGCRDMNEIKAITRAGMGACGGKTCAELIRRIFREEGIPAKEVTELVKRPLFVEVSFGSFAGIKGDNDG